MAIKRMFDKDTVRSDRFYELSSEAKAAWFLMGMDADDEGFISCKLLIRSHSIRPEAIDELEKAKFIIRFDSGVAVIVDWHTNNWLRKERIKPTIYQDERQKIKLNERKKLVLTK